MKAALDKDEGRGGAITAAFAGGGGSALSFDSALYKSVPPISNPDTLYPAGFTFATRSIWLK